MRKIKVLHFIRSFEIGGAEKLVVQLAREQKETYNIEPCIASFLKLGTLDEEARAAGIRTYFVSSGRIKYFSHYLGVYKLIKRVSPHIVHIHGFHSQIYAAPVAKMMRLPIVFTKHGRAVISMGKLPFLRKAIYNLSNIVVAVSKETSNSFSSKTGIDVSKVVVIYNGIDPDNLSILNKEESKGYLGFSKDSIVIGSVARLDKVKDHSTLIEAFAKVSSVEKNCILLIVGDGPERRNIEKKVNDLGLNDRVILTGFTDDVSRYLSAMDLFVQTSTEEGLSMTILEAMAAGLPIMVTPVGGNPELIQHGETGIFIPVGDSSQLASYIIKFIKDPSRFIEMGNKAKEIVREKFTLSNTAHQYVRVYKMLLGEV